jgi:hypothetical protein
MIRKSTIYLLKAELADLALQYSEIDPAIELRWVEPHERHLIIDSPYRPKGRTGAKYFERHYSENGRACAASVDGDLVAWRLFKPEFRKHWNWLEVRGGDSAVFGMAAFTAPHARGKRLMGIITCHAAREYLKSGFTTMSAAADCDNGPAMSAHSGIGMQIVGTVAFTRWPFGLKTVRINGNLTAGWFGDGCRLVHHVA